MPAAGSEHTCSELSEEQVCTVPCLVTALQAQMQESWSVDHTTREKMTVQDQS